MDTQRLTQTIRRTTFLLVVLGFSACSSDKPEKIQLTVGEIREINLPSRSDTTVQLIGSSDNEEVVAVSREELAAPVDTLKPTNSGSTVFQLKGITTGSAKVVFSERKTGEEGSGQPTKTYQVEVVNK